MFNSIIKCPFSPPVPKLIVYTHIICNSTITSAPGHEHGYNGL